MKECDISRGVKTYSDPPAYIQGVKLDLPTFKDLRPCMTQNSIAYTINAAYTRSA